MSWPQWFCLRQHVTFGSFGAEREHTFHTKHVYQFINYLHCKLSTDVEGTPSVARHLTTDITLS